MCFICDRIKMIKNNENPYFVRELMKQKLNQILAANTGKPLEQIAADTERDNFMTAQEAVAYGIIDKVIDHR